jgi:hypothetical protein
MFSLHCHSGLKLIAPFLSRSNNLNGELLTVLIGSVVAAGFSVFLTFYN